MCSDPHPQDTGVNPFELKSFGLYTDSAPLWLIIQRDRLKGRMVPEFGEHNVDLVRGWRLRAENIVVVEIRTAVLTVRERDFSMVIDW